jgi:hypothetical protein
MIDRAMLKELGWSDELISAIDGVASRVDDTASRFPDAIVVSHACEEIMSDSIDMDGIPPVASAMLLMR